MRGTRWLLLVAIVAIIGGVSYTYRAQRQAIRAAAPTKPTSLPEGLNFVGERSTWSEKAGDRPCLKYLIEAGSNRQLKDSSRVDMRDVTLKLFNKECNTYNLIKTAEAAYFPNDHRFVSQGQVQITLNAPMKGEAKHELVSIKTAGVTLDTNTGRAETDQWAIFTFENGDGTATGAVYDPDSHELQLKKDVIVHRHPPDVKPMTIEAGNLIYRETTGEVLLSPWGKLTRDNMVVEGVNPLIKLRKREYIQQVHASKAHGTDTTESDRSLRYQADDLLMDFNEKGAVQKMTGEGNAELVETSDSSETTVSGNHVEMNFVIPKKESLLDRVTAKGKAVASAKPLPVPGRELGETHILRSESIEMKMRPGGKDIESVVTHDPGTLEFLPNQPVQHHRLLTGKDMVIAYGDKNRIDSFHAVDVKTETDPNEAERKRARPVSVTQSRELAARFDPKTSKMSFMDQAGNFVYDEGERHARAAHATLDADNMIVLETGARLWDSSGSTTADRIRMNQNTGDFVADGNVKTSRMPEKDPKKNAQLLSGDVPLQAQAQHMESKDKNQSIHYQGAAQMWQGANKIQADQIDLNRDKEHREKRGLVADGSVISTLWEEPKEDAKKKGAVSVMTLVRAPHMVYTDENRLAVYSGGVQLTRGSNMKVKSHELRAYLADSGSDSSLEKAYADGAVEIVQVAPDRTRTGTAEHAEYFTDNDKVILHGGAPLMVDNLGGRIQAPELIYTASDGSLQGNGAAGSPVQSRIIRRSKK